MLAKSRPQRGRLHGFVAGGVDAGRTPHLSLAARRLAGGAEAFHFVVSENPAARQEPHAFRRLDGEAGAAARDDVDDQLSMPPILELRGANIELAASDLAEQHVLAADHELAVG